MLRYYEEKNFVETVSQVTLNPLAAEEFFFIFFFENLIKNTYYWLDQRKKVKNAKKKF